MKIDFNSNGMTINFDKVPNFLYYNEDDIGSGNVFIKGNQIKRLQNVKINAETNSGKIHPLEYRIQYLEEGTRTSKVIERVCERNTSGGLTVDIKILDLEQFQGILEFMKKLVKNDAVPDEIKHELMETMGFIFKDVEKDGE